MSLTPSFLVSTQRGAPIVRLEPPVVNAPRVERVRPLPRSPSRRARSAALRGRACFIGSTCARTRVEQGSPSVRMSASSDSRSIAARALWMVGSTKRRNDGIVLRAVDEDEAPGVLELALHGDEVELSANLGQLGRRRAPCASAYSAERSSMNAASNSW